MPDDATTIWTIGHSTRTHGEFLELLAANKIEALADVRRFPGSRKFPQFNQDVLRLSLPETGIAYAPMPELGGRRRPRLDSRNTAWRNESFRGYADSHGDRGVSRGDGAIAGSRPTEAIPPQCREHLGDVRVVIAVSRLRGAGCRRSAVSGDHVHWEHRVRGFDRVLIWAMPSTRDLASTRPQGSAKTDLIDGELLFSSRPFRQTSHLAHSSWLRTDDEPALIAIMERQEIRLEEGLVLTLYTDDADDHGQPDEMRAEVWCITMRANDAGSRRSIGAPCVMLRTSRHKPLNGDASLQELGLGVEDGNATAVSDGRLARPSRPKGLSPSDRSRSSKRMAARRISDHWAYSDQIAVRFVRIPSFVPAASGPWAASASAGLPRHLSWRRGCGAGRRGDR